jgi:hypothetical protein
MGLMNDNYQRWLDGEIGDSALNRLQSQLNRLQSQNRLFTLEEVHALEVSAVKATEERIIKLLEQASVDFEQWDFNAVGTTNWLISLIKVNSLFQGNIDNSNIHTKVDNEINGTSKSVLRRMAIQYPPESFRDKANGE